MLCTPATITVTWPDLISSQVMFLHSDKKLGFYTVAGEIPTFCFTWPCIRASLQRSALPGYQKRQSYRSDISINKRYLRTSTLQSAAFVCVQVLCVGKGHKPSGWSSGAFKYKYDQDLYQRKRRWTRAANRKPGIGDRLKDYIAKR